MLNEDNLSSYNLVILSYSLEMNFVLRDVHSGGWKPVDRALDCKLASSGPGVQHWHSNNIVIHNLKIKIGTFTPTTLMMLNCLSSIRKMTNFTVFKNSAV